MDGWTTWSWLMSRPARPHFAHPAPTSERFPKARAPQHDLAASDPGSRFVVVLVEGGRCGEPIVVYYLASFVRSTSCLVTRHSIDAHE